MASTMTGTTIDDDAIDLTDSQLRFHQAVQIADILGIIVNPDDTLTTLSVAIREQLPNVLVWPIKQMTLDWATKLGIDTSTAVCNSELTTACKNRQAELLAEVIANQDRYSPGTVIKVPFVFDGSAEIVSIPDDLNDSKARVIVKRIGEIAPRQQRERKLKPWMLGRATVFE